MTREDELIRQIQKGRQECLDELIELYYPAILRYCLWHMPDSESAQDAAQETFLKLVRFIGRYEHRGHFKAFLYRIAANACIDIKRSLAHGQVFRPRSRFRKSRTTLSAGRNPAIRRPKTDSFLQRLSHVCRKISGSLSCFVTDRS